MPPSGDDVQAMVIALFTVNTGLDRARRRSKGASTLSVLQILARRQGYARRTSLNSSECIRHS